MDDYGLPRMDAASRATRFAPTNASSSRIVPSRTMNPMMAKGRPRAALDYATELTRDKAVRPETFTCLARHFNEREICDIAYLVASEHLSNLTNVGLNIGSDGICTLNARQRARESTLAA